MSDPHPTPHARRFRLGRVLNERMLKEGSYAALARAITEASREGERDGRKAPRDVIDRRKLRSLVNGGNGAVLTVDDLFALDHYLSRFGESLAARPLLQKPDLMDALSTSGRVTFLLGSKHEAERGMVSEYDLHGMGEIQRSIGRSSEVGVSYDVQTVPLHPEPEATREAVRGYEALLDENGPSLVCLGSARSNAFSELLACAMLGYPAFAEGPLPPGATPPFKLIWNPDLSDLYKSHFRADPDSIRARNRAEAESVERYEGSALATPKKVYLDVVTPRGWGDTFGVCIAQRRRRGQVWLLLLGITGAATFVSAKLANRLATRLNEVREGQNSDIYWGIVEARVDASQKHELFNLRQFAREEIFTQTPLPAPEATD